MVYTAPMIQNTKKILFSLIAIIMLCGYAYSAQADQYSTYSCTNCSPYDYQYNWPVVSTNGASNVTSDSVTLQGYADGNGSSVRTWFEYGTTPALGSFTSSQYGGTRTNANAYINGLAPDTIYYYRFVATNSYQTSQGSIFSFRTHPPVVSSPQVIERIVYVNDRSTTKNTTTQKNSLSEETDTTNQLSASAASSGGSFFPGTFLGWLVISAIILILYVLWKKFQTKDETHAPHH